MSGLWKVSRSGPCSLRAALRGDPPGAGDGHLPCLPGELQGCGQVSGCIGPGLSAKMGSVSQPEGARERNMASRLDHRSPSSSLSSIPYPGAWGQGCRGRGRGVGGGAVGVWMGRGQWGYGCGGGAVGVWMGGSGSMDAVFPTQGSPVQGSLLGGVRADTIALRGEA